MDGQAPVAIGLIEAGGTATDWASLLIGIQTEDISRYTDQWEVVCQRGTGVAS